MAEVNRTMIIEALREHGPMSRRDLCARTGLSVATVNRLVSGLMASSLVTEVEVGPSTGGRPPQILQYNAPAQSVLAFDVGGRHTAGAVVDMEGGVLHREVWPTTVDDVNDQSAQVYERLLAWCERLLDRTATLGAPARAIGVGVPGVVRAESGMVEFAPALHWWAMPLGRLLAERMEIPVFVENNVNLLALAEHRRGGGQGAENVVTLVVGTGVGAGLILGGRLYRGWRGGAGEIGYMLMSPSALDRPWPGFGDLDTRLGNAGNATRALSGDGEPPLPEQVFALARSGDVAAREVMRDLTDQITQAVANVCVVVSPEVVVLGRGLRQAGSALLDSIAARLVGRIPNPPRLVLSELDDAGLVGAAEMAMEGIAPGNPLAGHVHVT